MPKKVLHLTLKKKWFDMIARGEKNKEFREIKPYWTKRLFYPTGKVREWDEIHFRNGYKKDSPIMRVKWTGCHTEELQGKKCYAIMLGQILDIKHNEVSADSSHD